MNPLMVWVKSNSGVDCMVYMVAERLEKFEELVALMELELLVHSV